MTEGYDLSVFTGVICVDYELGDKKCCHILDKSDNNTENYFFYAVIKLVADYDITSHHTVMKEFMHYTIPSKKSHKYLVNIEKQQDAISDIELYHPNQIYNIRFYLIKNGRKCKHIPTRNYQFNTSNYNSHEEFIIKFPKCYDEKEVMDNLSILYIRYFYKPLNVRRLLCELPDYFDPSVDL